LPPVPVTVRLRAKVCTKVAAAETFDVRLSWHGFVPYGLQVESVQPVKAHPEDGVAVSVTLDPFW
jgi:hypothetical protein